MRRILMLPVLLLSLALGVAGCAQVQKGIEIATTTITNPVDAVDIYRVKNVYAASLQAAVDWRNYCWSKPYATLMADPVAKIVCKNRRSTVRAIQMAQPKAASAIDSAQTFIANNPTLNAASVISAAWSAVTAFQNAVPAR